MYKVAAHKKERCRFESVQKPVFYVSACVRQKPKLEWEHPKAVCRNKRIGSLVSEFLGSALVRVCVLMLSTANDVLHVCLPVMWYFLLCFGISEDVTK